MIWAVPAMNVGAKVDVDSNDMDSTGGGSLVGAGSIVSAIRVSAVKETFGGLGLNYFFLSFSSAAWRVICTHSLSRRHRG